MASSPRTVSRMCAACRATNLIGAPGPRTFWTTTATNPVSRAPATRRRSPISSSSPSSLSQSRPLSRTATHRKSSNQQQQSSSAPSQTYYDLFPETLPRGPPPAGPFPVDVRALRREFLQLQARAHPDLHAAERKTAAQAASARINEAFRTLANPLARAQYLLSLRTTGGGGVSKVDDERGKVEDPALLMEVMEAREAIEDAAAEVDLVPIREENDDRIRRTEEVLEKAFRTDDLATAEDETIRLRYWIGIKDSLDNWEPGKPVEIGVGH